tara:strand:- start:1002 stop:2234 length:1233 start_codon:yes stop_codon:yes gene_type:complete
MRAREFISEGILSRIGSFFKNVYGKVIGAISNAFSKLDFGQTTSFKIPRAIKEANPVEREKFGLTGMIGYFNEHAVAYKLGKALVEAGVPVTTPGPGLQKSYEDYKQYILTNIEKFGKDAPKVESEVQRAEEGSTAMAEAMLKELTEARDILLHEVEIKHDGIEAMGAGKEDITITVKKKDTQEVEDLIKASLKLYNDPSGINVGNATFAAYISKILLGLENPGQGPKAIKAFLDALPQDKSKEYQEKIEAVLNITSQWSKMKTDLKKQGDPEYRKKANAFITQNKGYQKMSQLIFEDMFKYFYSQDKKGVNDRILKFIGLDGADDVYLAVGKVGKAKRTLSSRTSKKFGELYEALKADFDIEFEMPTNPEVVNVKMFIKDNGKTLAQFNIPFKEGGTFTHQFRMTELFD